jgi:hypothetical protein
MKKFDRNRTECTYGDLVFVFTSDDEQFIGEIIDPNTLHGNPRRWDTEDRCIIKALNLDKFEEGPFGVYFNNIQKLNNEELVQYFLEA